MRRLLRCREARAVPHSGPVRTPSWTLYGGDGKAGGRGKGSGKGDCLKGQVVAVVPGEQCPAAAPSFNIRALTRSCYCPVVLQHSMISPVPRCTPRYTQGSPYFDQRADAPSPLPPKAPTENKRPHAPPRDHIHASQIVRHFRSSPS